MGNAMSLPRRPSSLLRLLRDLRRIKVALDRPGTLQWLVLEAGFRMSHVRSIAFLLVALLPSIAMAEDDLGRGRAILEENCSRCHAVGATGASPLAAAPAFRTLGKRYPIDDLEEALAEGILTGHPTMPEFSFEPADVAAIIAYLKSLQAD